MPQMPTLPLLLGTFFSRKSIVSEVSEASSTSCGRFLVVDVRTHLDKLAFAHPASAHILVDEDVAGLFKLLRGPSWRGYWSSPYGRDTVRRAVHQKRIRAAGRILGNIDCREQPLAVAHRNPVLVFGVVGADVVFTRRMGAGCWASRSGNEQTQRGRERKKALQIWALWRKNLLSEQS